MESRPKQPRRLAHRYIVVLLAPTERLRELVPAEFEPVGRAGRGLLLLDTSQVNPLSAGGLRLGRACHRLTWKVPVRSRPSAPEVRGLWVARRWTSAGPLSRWWSARLAEGRRLAEARLGHATGLLAAQPSPTPLAATFHHREEGLHVELEVRSHQLGTSSRTAYLRAEAYGELTGSVFSSLRAAEEELQSWGPTLDAPRPGSEHETHCFASGPLGLQPLAVHALQTASLPELLPGIESEIALDSAFRTVRRRMEPLAKKLATWRELSSGGLGLPPEGAYLL